MLHRKARHAIAKTRPDHGKRASNNEDVVLLRPELLAVQALKGVQLEGLERDILREIRQGNQKED